MIVGDLVLAQTGVVRTAIAEDDGRASGDGDDVDADRLHFQRGRRLSGSERLRLELSVTGMPKRVQQCSSRSGSDT